jgi:hypothetical protein
MAAALSSAAAGASGGAAPGAKPIIRGVCFDMDGTLTVSQGVLTRQLFVPGAWLPRRWWPGLLWEAGVRGSGERASVSMLGPPPRSRVHLFPSLPKSDPPPHLAPRPQVPVIDFALMRRKVGVTQVCLTGGGAGRAAPRRLRSSTLCAHQRLPAALVKVASLGQAPAWHGSWAPPLCGARPGEQLVDRRSSTPSPLGQHCRSNAGQTAGQGDILDVINSWPEAERARAYAAIAEIEEAALADMKVRGAATGIGRGLDGTLGWDGKGQGGTG